MADKPSYPNRPGLGIFLILVGVTAFVTQAAFIKFMPRIPAGEVMFVRSISAMIATLIWLKAQNTSLSGLGVTRWYFHVIRGLVGSAAMGLGFYSLHLLPLPEITAIRFVTPVLIVLLAAVFLGERFRIIRIGAVLLGLIGVLIITWPRLSGGINNIFAIGTVLVLLSAIFAAIAQLLVKAMSRTETTTSVVFWFAAMATVFSLFSIPFGWVWPNGDEVVLLIGVGVVGSIGQILVTASYRYADAGVLAPFTYASMLWSLVIGFLWFAEYPTAPMLLGAALVILAGVIIFYRERQLAGLSKTG